MDIETQIKAKVGALRSVLWYIAELKKIQATGNSNGNELIDLEQFIETQINNYKLLVNDLNKKIGG